MENYLYLIGPSGILLLVFLSSVFNVNYERLCGEYVSVRLQSIKALVRYFLRYILHKAEFNEQNNGRTNGRTKHRGIITVMKQDKGSRKIKF